MRPELIEHLDSQLGIDSSKIKIYKEEAHHVVEGVLEQAQKQYPIHRGVPSFLPQAMQAESEAPQSTDELSESQKEQQKTNVTFSDKWKRFTRYGLETGHQEFLQQWYCKKLGLKDPEDLKAFYQDKHCILEVGPGSGFNTRFMAEHSPGTVLAADISEAAHTTFSNTKDLANCHVVQADLMDLPFPDDHFDFIIADGVLHHTPNTRKAVEALYRKVKPNGQFFFYVYREMGAARAFCDAHIREAFTQLSPEECYKACEPLTELGRELSKINATITLEKPIPVLGIPAGEHDVQRLLYYNFVKCFWNDAFDYETNNMVNFDWYHPHNAWQHSEEEVTQWLKEIGAQEYQFNPANPNGLSVLVRKAA